MQESEDYILNTDGTAFLFDPLASDVVFLNPNWATCIEVYECERKNEEYFPIAMIRT